MKTSFPFLLFLISFSVSVSAFQTEYIEPDSSFIKLYVENYQAGHYDKALYYCKQAIDYFSQKQDTFFTVRYRVRMADIYRANRDYQNALSELADILPFAQKYSDQTVTGFVYAVFASTYYEIHQNETAEKYIKLAIEIFDRGTDKDLQSYSHNVLGAVYRELKKYDLSLEQLLISLEISKSGDPENIPNILNNISLTYTYLKQYDKAIEYSRESLKLSRKSGVKVYISLALNSLYQAYYGQRNFEKAYYALLQYHTFLQDTLYKASNEEMINSIRTQYETEKKETENKALKIRIENQRIITISTIVGLVLLSIIIVTLIVLYRNKGKTEKILLEQKRQMEIYNENLIRINVEIQENEKRLKNLNQVKDKWFSIISHDIRSPIGTLLSTLKYNEDFEPKEMNEILISIGAQVETTFNMIDNLLQWSYSQLSGFHTEPSKINVNALIRENILLLNPTAEKKNLKFIFDDSGSVFGWADKNMINLVVRNLMSNAIKFSRENNEIIISSKLLDGKIMVSVKDHGIGISENELTTLFIPQEGKSKYGTSNEKGVGFGLVLCHDFVKSNGGEISVVTKQGEGSEFTFSVPVFEETV